MAAVPNRGPELVAVCSTFISLALASVLLRIYVRLRLVKAFGWDDAFIVIALGFHAMFTICAIKGVKWGTGRHMANLNEEQITNALKYWYLCYPAYCLSMVAAKISVGVFLLRLTVQPLYRRIIYTVMVATALTGIIFFFVSVLQCTPVSYFWNLLHMTGTCVNIDVIVGIAFSYSIVASICDFTFGLLPIFLVWNLNMARSQKIMLAPILSMACVASVAVTVRMAYLSKFKSNDFLWDTLDVAIWSDIEQGLGITAASLATLRPLYRKVMKRCGLSDAASQPPSGQQKSWKEWHRNPSGDHHKRKNPFSLASITRAGDEHTRLSESMDEELATGLTRPESMKLESRLAEEHKHGFNTWKIEVGDRSDDGLTDSQGITKHTDVFLQSAAHRAI